VKHNPSIQLTEGVPHAEDHNSFESTPPLTKAGKKRRLRDGGVFTYRMIIHGKNLDLLHEELLNHFKKKQTALNKEKKQKERREKAGSAANQRKEAAAAAGEQRKDKAREAEAERKKGAMSNTTINRR
jgi:hypothetical protein